ncbi:MAG: hypothetical protein GX605_09975 [Chloroflexi bacterium]|nr:hypothetical protein [Chloroflexota bacterium]
MPENVHVVNAWREILRRIFEGVAMQENVTPSWLTNPSTGRRLKLDQLYPEIGLAVRFRGLQGVRQRRLSESEEALEAAREQQRLDLCRQAGVQLVTVDLIQGTPVEVFKALRSALSAAASSLTHSAEPHERKVRLMEQIAASKNACDQMARRVRQERDLAVYAELWQDRAYHVETASMEPSARPTLPQVRYRVGMVVWHATYGQGEVQAVEDEASETYVTVRFDDDRERRFAASLIQSKLLPR